MRDPARNGWTDERRRRQAARVRDWKPWEAATGPRTEVGKAVSARNAYKGGEREMLRGLCRVLRDQARELETLSEK